MSLAHLKNKVTAEIREVERGSQEYMELAAQRITREHLGDAGEGVEEQPHRPLWEDRGVAGHAELGLEPAVGNINDRDYNDPSMFPAVEREEEDPPEFLDDELATGPDREIHAKHEPPSEEDVKKTPALDSKYETVRAREDARVNRADRHRRSAEDDEPNASGERASGGPKTGDTGSSPSAADKARASTGTGTSAGATA